FRSLWGGVTPDPAVELFLSVALSPLFHLPSISSHVPPSPSTSFSHYPPGEFRRSASDLFGVEARLIRLWNFFSQSSEHPMDNDANTLGEEGIVHGQTIVVQVYIYIESQG